MCDRSIFCASIDELALTVIFCRSSSKVEEGCGGENSGQLRLFSKASDCKSGVDCSLNPIDRFIGFLPNLPCPAWRLPMYVPSVSLKGIPRKEARIHWLALHLQREV